MLIGAQLAFLGLLAMVVGLLLRSWRVILVGLGGLAVVAGLWVALPPMTVDAYPTTFRRSSVPYHVVSVASGAALFRTHCATCHGAGGRGDGPGGAGLPRPPADLTAPHTAQHTAGDMFWWLTHGIPAGGMPAFDAVLSEEERWDLINFIRTLAAGEQARQMTALVPPGRPWLVAPDFAIVVGPGPPRSLKDLRDRWMALLVLFTLPESRARLVQLAEAYNTLQALGTEIVAVPQGDGSDIIRRLGGRPPHPLPGDHRRRGRHRATYALLARGLGPAPRGAPPLHAEFLIDRQGYIRARWLPGRARARAGTASDARRADPAHRQGNARRARARRARTLGPPCASGGSSCSSTSPSAWGCCWAISRGAARPRGSARELEIARRQQVIAGVERTWQARGVVRAVLPELNVVVLTHEDLLGYMGSMTMGFRVHDPKLYEGLDIGDRVRFTLTGVPPNVEITALAKEAP